MSTLHLPLHHLLNCSKIHFWYNPVLQDHHSTNISLLRLQELLKWQIAPGKKHENVNENPKNKFHLNTWQFTIH